MASDVVARVRTARDVGRKDQAPPGRRPQLLPTDLRPNRLDETHRLGPPVGHPRGAGVSSLLAKGPGKTHAGQGHQGVTGEVYFQKETPFGLILIGGRGPNTYDLDV